MTSKGSKAKLLNMKNQIAVESVPLKIGAEKTSYILKMKLDPPTPKPIKNRNIDLPFSDESRYTTFMGPVVPDELNSIEITNNDAISDCFNSLIQTSKSMQKYESQSTGVKPKKTEIIELLEDEETYSEVTEESQTIGRGKKRQCLYQLHSLKIIPKCEHKTPEPPSLQRINETRRTYGKKSNVNTTKNKKDVQNSVDEGSAQKERLEYNKELVKIDMENFLKRPVRPPYLSQLPPQIKPVRVEQPRRMYQKKQKKQKTELFGEDVEVTIDCDPQTLLCPIETLKEEEEEIKIEIKEEPVEVQMIAFINEEDQNKFAKENVKE